VEKFLAERVDSPILLTLSGWRTRTTNRPMGLLPAVGRLSGDVLNLRKAGGGQGLCHERHLEEWRAQETGSQTWRLLVIPNLPL